MSTDLKAPATLTQAERTAISDRAMLAAATELLLERGVEKTTLAAIGERAGYSRGLAGYRFGSKAGLFDELCKDISRRWLDYLSARVEAKPAWTRCAARWIRSSRTSPTFPEKPRCCRFCMGSRRVQHPSFDRPQRVSTNAQLDDVADWVRGGVRDGSIRNDVDANSVAAQYIAYISGLTYLWLINPSSVDVRKANDDMKIHLRRSLQSGVNT